MSQNTETTKASGQSSLFDLRLILAFLFVVYGLILTIMGFVPQSDEAMAKTGGWNVNLWTGLVMLVVAVAFGLWARLRPLLIEPASSSDEETPTGH